MVSLFGYTPDFGRFYGSRGTVYCRLPRSPKTSLIAHAKWVHGRTGFDGDVTSLFRAS